MAITINVNATINVNLNGEPSAVLEPEMAIEHEPHVHVHRGPLPDGLIDAIVEGMFAGKNND